MKSYPVRLICQSSSSIKEREGCLKVNRVKLIYDYGQSIGFEILVADHDSCKILEDAMVAATKMKLSIVIVNWKVRDLLRNCLKSVFVDGSCRSLEVIVVDNNSGDGSTDMIKEEFPQVRLIENRQNLGFGRACNQGIRMARGKYLFILNPDSEVTNGTYERVINFMDSHHRAGVGGCSLYYPDGRIQTSFFKFTSLWGLLGRALLLYSVLPRNRFTAPFFVDYLGSKKPLERVCGGAMVVRREALEEVGLFDESFFLYYEDEDLCYRMKQKGWEIASIPNTKVIHYHNQSAQKNIRRAIFSSYRSQFLYYRKFHSFHKVVMFRMVQLLGVFIRSLFWFFKFTTDTKQEEGKQRIIGYLSLMLSNFYYTKTLLN